jgi:AcrR family transcriptional regulator
MFTLDTSKWTLSTSERRIAIESMPRASAKPYHHGDLRAALIDAGTKLLRERGAAGLSLREVAKAAGVSHAAPYRHFEDKGQLLAAIAAAGFERLRAGMAKAAADHPDDPRAQLIAAGEAYVELAAKHPETMHLMFGGMIEPGKLRGALGEKGPGAFGDLVAIIESGQRAGIFARGETIELALASWSIAHGLGMLLAGGQLGPGKKRTPSELKALASRVIALGVGGLMRE